MPIISTATSAYTNTSNLATQQSVANAITPGANKQANPATVSADNSVLSTTGVVVTLSAQAQQASSLNDSTAAGGQKSFAQVAIDARASMDAQYAAMKASGKPFDINSWEGKDWNTLMGSLDRRSLYAVRSNEGGRFTKDEQNIAQSFMVQQQGLAMGLYSGPTSKAGAFISPFSSVSDGFKNGVHFLDSVSSEEKSSVEWAMARASAQIAYEAAAENEHKVPEKIDSENPLVALITSAMKSMQHHPKDGWTTGSITTLADLKRQPWMHGFETKLDQVVQQMQGTQSLQKYS